MAYRKKRSAVPNQDDSSDDSSNDATAGPKPHHPAFEEDLGPSRRILEMAVSPLWQLLTTGFTEGNTQVHGHEGIAVVSGSVGQGIEFKAYVWVWGGTRRAGRGILKKLAWMVVLVFLVGVIFETLHLVHLALPHTHPHALTLKVSALTPGIQVTERDSATLQTRSTR
jgi:hypothetical protein